MKRRDFVTGLGAGAVAAGVAACGQDQSATAGPAVQTSKTLKLKWKMVTTWPPNFPGLGTGATFLAKTIGELSDGQITVKVYGGGELVPPLEVFGAVSNGTAEIGHGAAYYWKGKVPAAQFFTAVPFGMNAQEMAGWLYFGGGLELWRELYAPFNLVPHPAGNTGVQMGGWFNREINSVEDLVGLKMRIPGLGGEVLKRAGGIPVLRSGGEIATSLQTGDIDATEWVGPYNDLAFGLHKLAKYYYYPGWHEPGATLECIINKDAFEELPEHLQNVVTKSAALTNETMLAEYTAQNNRALQTLLQEHQIDLRRFPDPVLARLKELSQEVLEETARDDPLFSRVFSEYQRFFAAARNWHSVSEFAMYNAGDA